MATTSLDLPAILLPLIPVVAGGVIALLGVFGGGLLTHWLKARADRKIRSAEKLEDLLLALFSHKHWLGSMNSHRVFGGEAPTTESPIARIRAVTSLYFPDFKTKVQELDIAADQYELWMFKAGQERLEKGVLSQEILAGAGPAYQPYLTSFHALLKALEAHATTVDC